MYDRVLFLSLDCSTLPLIHTLYYWVLSKEVSSTIFKIFGMKQSGIEPRSPRPLTNTLPTRPMRIAVIPRSILIHSSSACLGPIYGSNRNLLIVCKQIGSLKNVTNKLHRGWYAVKQNSNSNQQTDKYNIYMNKNKQDLTLNNLQKLICYKTRPIWIKPISRSTCSVMVNALDCKIVVSEFELQSCYYVHFGTNTLGKGMNLLILQAIV